MSGRFKIPFLTSPAIEAEPAAPIITPAPREDQESVEQPAERSALLDERVKIHNKLIDEFNLSFLDKMARDDLRKHVASFVRNYVLSEYIPMNQGELEQFVEEIIDEMVGLGPIEPLL
ncbi:MAG: hypothetical protein N2444_11075, partial [Methylocystis sp.]|nr:hypothetical protein [Methylocystis sp.]